MTTPLEVIPEHLREYITEQDPALYTPIDQAVWRYVMRVSKDFFSKHGHPMYLQGLAATGIPTETIPSVETMDLALRKLGWRAVAINGFIPPAIFLEFQSLKILAIACDIRKLENLGYTPSPDIIHEAAGHAPIVADPSYRAYLEAYGEVARNAIISKYDLEIYEAILKLSEIKENPRANPESVIETQAAFEKIAARETIASEAALLARMNWWTAEYGMIEKDGKQLIYGAGLLSSVSESFNCIKPNVKKIPFSLEGTLKTSYDITREQPQLFVATPWPSAKVAFTDCKPQKPQKIPQPSFLITGFRSPER
jgi:phenylalanine-4-hydroxylase